MTDKQTELTDFGDDLAKIRTDSKMNWAGVKEAEPMIKEAFFDSLDPSDDDAGDEGLRIVFETATGRQWEQWFAKPSEWDPVRYNLVLLLGYWGLDPGEIDRLIDGDEVFEIPTVQRDTTVPDWPEIERTVHTRQLEEADNAE